MTRYRPAGRAYPNPAEAVVCPICRAPVGMPCASLHGAGVLPRSHGVRRERAQAAVAALVSPVPVVTSADRRPLPPDVLAAGEDDLPAPVGGRGRRVRTSRSDDLTLTPVPATLPGLMEMLSSEIYATMRFGREASTPPWAPGGNSGAQEHARDLARRFVRYVRVDMTDAIGRTRVARALGFGSDVTFDGETIRDMSGMGGAVVPGLLADLDPDDPRTLPDGSRWVDAEALARVAVHVLGGDRG